MNPEDFNPERLKKFLNDLLNQDETEARAMKLWLTVPVNLHIKNAAMAQESIPDMIHTARRVNPQLAAALYAEIATIYLEVASHMQAASAAMKEATDTAENLTKVAMEPLNKPSRGGSINH
jgi:hypothetical protein